MKNTTKIIAIPPESSERFVNFAEFGGGAYAGGSIFMAAVCAYPAGYHVRYPAARRHLVLFCRLGRFHCNYEGCSVLLSEGEALVLPAGGCQEIRSEGPAESVFFLLTPGPAWGEPVFHRRATAEGELLRQLMGKALRLSADRPDRESVFREGIGRMVFELLQDEVRGADRDRTPFELLRARMRLHPEQRWSVAEMASRCGVSAPHFFVLCRRHYGMSPYQMLKKLRMEQACELLTSTSYPVKVVASLCGYDHLFSFSRCFRSIFHAPPTRYRREHRAGAEEEVPPQAKS